MASHVQKPLELATGVSVRPDMHIALDMGPVEDLHCDSNDQLWWLAGGTVGSYDVARGQRRHYSDMGYVGALSIDDEHGYFGLEASLVRFRLRNPDDRQSVAIPGSVLSIANWRAQRPRTFCATSDGQVLEVEWGRGVSKVWNCEVLPFRIHVARDGRTLWSVGDGIEVIDLIQRKSQVFPARYRSGYTGISEGCVGQIVVFGGDIEMFESAGNISCVLTGGDTLDFISGVVVAEAHIIGRVIPNEHLGDDSAIRRARVGELVVDCVPSGDPIAVATSRSFIAAASTEGVILYPFLSR